MIASGPPRGLIKHHHHHGNKGRDGVCPGSQVLMVSLTLKMNMGMYEFNENVFSAQG